MITYDDAKPYLRLWAAVFQRGISDYCTARTGKDYQHTAVHHWFWDDVTVRPGKFAWLCQLFDISPDKARARILSDWRAYVDKATAVKEIA